MLYIKITNNDSNHFPCLLYTHSFEWAVTLAVMDKHYLYAVNFKLTFVGSVNLAVSARTCISTPRYLLYQVDKSFSISTPPYLLYQVEKY